MSQNSLVKKAKEQGWSLLPDNAQWTHRIEIRSETSDNLYIVAQHKGNGTWACSCFGWRRHRRCKHLNSMMPTLKMLGTRE